MVESYRFIRCTWWRRREMEELERKLGEDFEIRRLLVPTDEREVVPSPFEREGLSVSADTVKARLAPMRAVLFQRERAPFTRRDLALRERIMELYPRNRSTPFTLGVLDEPDFEIAAEENE